MTYAPTVGRVTALRDETSAHPDDRAHDALDFARLRFADVLDDTNRECLVVYDILKQAVERCAALVPPFANVPLLMFPVFMTVLTQYRIFHQEQQRGLARADLRLMRQKAFPYVDHVAVAEGLKVEEKQPSLFDPAPQTRPIDRKHAALSTVLGVLPRRARVALFQWELGADLLTELLHQGICFFAPSLSALGVPLAAQWPVVEQALSEICDRFAMGRDRRALADLLLDHTRQYLIEGAPEPLMADALVVGNLLHLSNRVMAARARCGGTPVVTVAHGQCSGMIGEPVCGYGEATLATHEFGYASAGMRERPAMPLARSLIADDEPLGAIASDAERVAAIYRPAATIEPLDLAQSSPVYYVPTGFNNLHTYGPYRMMPDVVYARWQQHVLAQFPEAILKAYPWQKDTDWAYGAMDPARICLPPLEQVLDKAGAFIFDYNSTGLLMACATNKPVIFFDVGLRLQSPLALEAIRERCIYIRVEHVLDPSLREQVMARADEPKRNRVSPTFSLEGLGEPRARSLARSLKRMIARKAAERRKPTSCLEPDRTATCG
jgi:hypothetical protein